MFGITFPKKPSNYLQIDDFVSRSAQPRKSGIKWLKKQGVTDIISFRKNPPSSFDEKAYVEELGMKYHNIPMSARKPSEEKVGQFLDLVEGIKEMDGRVHIHCKAGADRTGMFSWIYKQKNGIGSMSENKSEMFHMGYDPTMYPRLIRWIEDFLYKGWR